MDDAQTATEAFERYKSAFDNDALVQNTWHTELDGRQLACGLGVLGDKIDSPSKCPAAIMPRWLAQMVPWFFDYQTAEDAKSWGLAFFAELSRIGGKVPFSVIHDWQANVVGPLAIETAEKRGRKPEVHQALADMQSKALAGQKFTAEEWKPILKAAFFDANPYANANPDAYAYANANAMSDANSYAVFYANADANAYVYANPKAYAYAASYANAIKIVMKRVADGMVECLKRVEA